MLEQIDAGRVPRVIFQAGAQVRDGTGLVAQCVVGYRPPIVAFLQDGFRHVSQCLGCQADHIFITPRVIICRVGSGLIPEDAVRA